MNKPFASRLDQLIGPRGFAVAGLAERVAAIPNRGKGTTEVKKKGERRYCSIDDVIRELIESVKPTTARVRGLSRL